MLLRSIVQGKAGAPRIAYERLALCQNSPLIDLTKLEAVCTGAAYAAKIPGALPGFSSRGLRLRPQGLGVRCVVAFSVAPGGGRDAMRLHHHPASR